MKIFEIFFQIFILYLALCFGVIVILGTFIGIKRSLEKKQAYKAHRGVSWEGFVLTRAEIHGYKHLRKLLREYQHLFEKEESYRTEKMGPPVIFSASDKLFSSLVEEWRVRRLGHLLTKEEEVARHYNQLSAKNGFKFSDFHQVPDGEEVLPRQLSFGHQPVGG